MLYAQYKYRFVIIALASDNRNGYTYRRRQKSQNFAQCPLALGHTGRLILRNQSAIDCAFHFSTRNRGARDHHQQQLNAQIHLLAQHYCDWRRLECSMNCRRGALTIPQQPSAALSNSMGFPVSVRDLCARALVMKTKATATRATSAAALVRWRTSLSAPALHNCSPRSSFEIDRNISSVWGERF